MKMKPCVIVLTVLVPVIVLAASKTCKVSGIVNDHEGNAIRNALVSHPHCGARTDAKGFFAFQIPTNTVMKYPPRPPRLKISRLSGRDASITHYITEKLDLQCVGAGLPIDLGEITWPAFDTNTVVRGKLVGATNAFPWMIWMQHTSTNITGLLAPSKRAKTKGLFAGRGFPEGEYVLTNVPDPCRPNKIVPRTAAAFRRTVVVTNGCRIDVTINVELRKPKKE